MKKKTKKQENNFENMELVPSNINKYVAKDFHLYFSYTWRLILIIIGIIVIGIISYTCFKNSFSTPQDETVKYSEKASMDYEVKVFENNPLGITNNSKVDTYLSEVVDDISTNLTYEYILDKNANIIYTYKVVATMILKNADTDTVFYNNDYDLTSDITKEEHDTEKIIINQNINLDYDYYNEKAKNIEELSGGDKITGSLIIKMYVTTQTSLTNLKNVIINDNVVEVEIPLLSNQVSVDLISDINNDEKYLEEENPELLSRPLLCIGVLLLIFDVIFILLTISFILKTNPGKSRYAVIRDDILYDYDNLIINMKSMPDLKEREVIKCESFNELLDAQKILEKPILFYEVVKNQKSLFIILGDDNIYQYTLKEVDIEE